MARMATSNTRISDLNPGYVFVTAVTLLSQPEAKLRNIATANSTPIGKPIATCLKNLFCLTRFSSQYFIKSSSSFENMSKITKAVQQLAIAQ